MPKVTAQRIDPDTGELVTYRYPSTDAEGNAYLPPFTGLDGAVPEEQVEELDRGVRPGQVIQDDLPAQQVHGLNFKTGLSSRLHPKKTFVKGELQEVIHYRSATINPDLTKTYEDPVVRETFAYLRSGAGFAIMRTHTIEWMDFNGEWALSKVQEKFYDEADVLREAKTRRQNVADFTMMGMIFLLDQTVPEDAGTPNVNKGRALWQAHKDSIDLYIDAGIRDIETEIGNDVTAWLDNPIGPGVTIRDWTLNELDIWS